MDLQRHKKGERVSYLRRQGHDSDALKEARSRGMKTTISKIKLDLIEGKGEKEQLGLREGKGEK